MPTIFTRIIHGEIPCHKVWEDERFFAFLDIKPIQPGHTLVVSKQEIDSPFEMDDETYAAFLLAAKRLVEPIRRAMGSAKVGLVIEGLEVPHAHIKLVPISEPSDLAQANAKDAMPEELVAVAGRIRAEIGTA
ncbi:HIT family protein [Patescibacteria group bacterium]|nr:HIT family protein [Patescibacteria group bacterium]MBU1448840.1 HIT family protein [Patescibacteria group bacterium]MBU2613497.1 HIT family protein [Patescibacteria group bacterium]